MNQLFSSSDRDSKYVSLQNFSIVTDYLCDRTPELRQSYLAAKPFPHLVLDDLFPPALLERIVAEFPKQEDRDWLVWDNNHELKTTSHGIRDLSLFTQLFCHWLSSDSFISVLESIVGVSKLVGDPLFHGAGLHEMYRNGWLEMHADYTKHYSLPLVRRFNILIYLNQDWDPNWGGELVLQDPKNPKDKASHPCTFNRTIIFPTTAKTFHGVPTPLSCPVDRTRKLISVYYWNAIPMPLWAKAGTPLLWASRQKRNLKRILKS